MTSSPSRWSRGRLICFAATAQRSIHWKASRRRRETTRAALRVSADGDETAALARVEAPATALQLRRRRVYLQKYDLKGGVALVSGGGRAIVLAAGGYTCW